jgi:hypothetical protein
MCFPSKCLLRKLDEMCRAGRFSVSRLYVINPARQKTRFCYYATEITVFSWNSYSAVLHISLLNYITAAGHEHFFLHPLQFITHSHTFITHYINYEFGKALLNKWQTRNIVKGLIVLIYSRFQFVKLASIDRTVENNTFGRIYKGAILP